MGLTLFICGVEYIWSDIDLHGLLTGHFIPLWFLKIDHLTNEERYDII